MAFFCSNCETGEPLKFSLWGIVSGLFWVPGSIAGIYAIRNAGLAVSVGTWSALNVVSSLIWGIFIFQESVKSKIGTCCGASVLIVGLVGMSKYSKPKPSVFKEKVEPVVTKDEKVDEGMKGDPEEEALIKDTRSKKNIILRSNVTKSSSKVDNDRNSGNYPIDRSQDNDSFSDSDSSMDQLVSIEIECDNEKDKHCSLHTDNLKNITESDIVHIMGKWNVSRRDLGLIGAIINGTWGSTCLIPMHYAK